jgi:hypothetical protein
MFTFLKRSYPLLGDSKESLRIAAYIAVFVFVFLSLFQPFGLSDDKPKLKFLLISGYAAVTFLVLIVNLLCVTRLLKNVFIEEKWTVLKEIVWNLWIVFSVGLGIYVFICLFDIIFGFFRLGFMTFLLFQLMTFVIALFPITAVAVLKEYRLLRRNVEAAGRVSAVLQDSQSHEDEHDHTGDTQKVTLVSDGGTKKHVFDKHSVLYISAEGNYVNVVCKHFEIESVMIRSSLKNIEEQLKGYSFFFRCHRAFIVNIRKIKEANGNAQGIRLTLEGVDQQITVSRSYYKDFKRIMGIT